MKPIKVFYNGKLDSVLYSKANTITTRSPKDAFAIKFTVFLVLFIALNVLAALK